MATWEDILQEGSYGGVRFDFVSARDEHSNDLDIQRFPNRPGQRVEARARNGVRFDIMAIFIEDDYPNTLNDLIKKLDDGGVPKELVHPIFGAIKASCERFTVNHDVEDAADSATVQITFQEHTEGSGLTQTKKSVPARANAARSALTDVLAAVSAFEAALDIKNSAVGLQIIGAMNAVEGTVESLEATGDQLSTLAVQSMTNGTLALIQVPIAALDDYDSIEKYELATALRLSASTLSEMATEIIETKPPLSSYVVRADTNLLALAFDLYGTADRADELLALNSFPDPSLILAGSTYIAYAE